MGRRIKADALRTQLLVTKKDELRKYEESLHQRQAQLNDREANILAMESALRERESACRVKEEMAADTQKRLNIAAEALKAQWDKLRDERDELAQLGMPVMQIQEREQLGQFTGP